MNTFLKQNQSSYNWDIFLGPKIIVSLYEPYYWEAIEHTQKLAIAHNGLAFLITDDNRRLYLGDFVAEQGGLA